MMTPAVAARLSALLLIASLGIGCASTIHGSEQMVMIVTRPPGAAVYINGVVAGQNTPAHIPLPRDKKAVVRLEYEGYVPRELKLKRGPSAWLLMNFGLCALSGGQGADSNREAVGLLFGCFGALTAIDLLSGGAYTLQKRIDIELSPKHELE